jgi:hypothetical protein
VASGAYFRIRGFVFESSPYTSGGNVDIYGHHVEVSGNEVRNAKDQGIYSAEESHHVQILQNLIHHNGRASRTRATASTSRATTTWSRTTSSTTTPKASGSRSTTATAARSSSPTP